MNEADKFLQEYLEKAQRNTQKTASSTFSFESPRPQTTQQQNRGVASFGVNARVQQQGQATSARTIRTEPKRNVQYAPQQGVQYEVPMGEAWKRFWTNWSLAGRSSRSEVWKWILWFIILWIGMALISVFLIRDESFFLQKSCLLLFAWPYFALQTRRLHDIGRTCLVAVIANLIGILTGILMHVNQTLAGFTGFATFIFVIVMLCIYCIPSQPHENKYGPVPNVR